jgi:sodium pump decarboxylase gamma subunit
MENIGIFEAAVTAVTGYGVVFLGLVLLMGCVTLLGRVMQRRNLPKEAVAEIPSAPAPAAPEAPGACGVCALNGVDDRTAAMLMAIVADQLQTPLNQLRFISIREIKEEASNAV